MEQLYTHLMQTGGVFVENRIMSSAIKFKATANDMFYEDLSIACKKTTYEAFKNILKTAIKAAKEE